MWKADFGAVDGAIADCFDESERLVVSRIEDYALEGCLLVVCQWLWNCVREWMLAVPVNALPNPYPYNQCDLDETIATSRKNEKR